MSLETTNRSLAVATVQALFRRRYCRVALLTRARQWRVVQIKPGHWMFEWIEDDDSASDQRPAA